MNLSLLDDVKKIIAENEEEINKTGKGFNLISLLGMEHNERYTHSNIIAELLKHNGSHTFGNKFFELFLEEVGIEDFSTTHYEVVTEEYFSDVKCGMDESMRTFLDIVVKDQSSGKVILIENKIWAIDQFQQLERYYECYKEKIVKLFYLNVFEWSDSPTKKLDVLKVFQNISYKNNIKNWLKKCIEISSEKPYVNQQIEAYYQIVLKISNSNNNNNMSEKVKNKMTENLENFQTAEQIAYYFNQVSADIPHRFYSEIKKQLIDNELINTKFGNLKITVSEDNDDPIYLGVQLMSPSNEMVVTDNAEFNSIIKILRNKFSQNLSNGNNNWNVWFYLSKNNPLYNVHIYSSNTETKFSLLHNLEREVDNVVKEFGEIIKELKMML